MDTGIASEILKVETYSGNIETNFLGLPTYVEICTAYDKLISFVTESEFEFQVDQIKDGKYSGFQEWYYM